MAHGVHCYHHHCRVIIDTNIITILYRYVQISTLNLQLTKKQILQ